jgi:hypothetical protein
LGSGAVLGSASFGAFAGAFFCLLIVASSAGRHARRSTMNALVGREVQSFLGVR